MNESFIQNFTVKNFKNLEEKILLFSPSINCIFGDNGNGKTNLLESIYYLINRKSFKKKSTFQQLISVECEKPEILFSSTFQTEGKNNSLSGKVNHLGSEWYYNNTSTKKKYLSTVLISPFDSGLFHSDPQYRRQWVDTHFSLISKNYKNKLSEYKKVLKFRNTLLQKKPYHFEKQIEAISEKFALLSFELVQLREDLTNQINRYCSLTFKEIFHEKHQLNFNQESQFKNQDVNQIKQFFDDNLEKDCILGRTKSGIHRDNFSFEFDGYNSFEYCSLGQQKMSFLSLVFAYIELFRYKIGTYPIVLMDDVSGELDKHRWLNLINFLKNKKFQVFITTANENFKIELEKIESSKKFLLHDGKVQDY